MDTKALANLRLKIGGFIENCVLVDSSIAHDKNWDQIENLSLSISKLKPEWISRRQAHVMVSSIVNGFIPKLDDGARFDGKLSEFVDVEGLCLQIYNRVIGLPYQYDIYYELPNVSLPASAEIIIGSGVSIQVLSDGFVRPESLSNKLGFRLESTSCYIKTRVDGYCDYDSAGSTPQDSLTLFKVFVERGKASGVLLDNFFLRFWPQKIANSLVYVHEVSGGEAKPPIRLSISKDIAEALTSLQLSTALYRNENIQQSLLEGMGDFLKLTSSNDISLSRIIAACEWSFDAYSEHVPAMQVVKTCIGLESVYGEDNSEGGLTKSLSDRCAYSLASSTLERKEIMTKCRELYKLRSSVVHGVKRRISTSDAELINFGMAVLTSSINKEISLLPDIGC